MEPKSWITINGVHVPLFDGDSKTSAVQRFYASKHGKDIAKLSSKGKNEKYDDNKFKYLPEDDDEAHDLYWDMSDECYDKLSKKDRDLINYHYVKTAESYDINEGLRNNTKLSNNQLDTIKALDRACKTYTAKNDMASTRFVDLEYLKNVYKLDGDDRYSFYQKMLSQIGTQTSSNGFTSVSLNSDGNGMFNSLAVKMKVNIPKGTKMYVAENWGEAEAILGRNTKLELKAVNFKKSNIIKDERFGQILLTYEVVD